MIYITVASLHCNGQKLYTEFPTRPGKKQLYQDVCLLFVYQYLLEILHMCLHFIVVMSSPKINVAYKTLHHVPRELKIYNLNKVFSILKF